MANNASLARRFFIPMRSNRECPKAPSLLTFVRTVIPIVLIAGFPFYACAEQIEVGDKLSFKIAEVEELSSDFIVDADGFIILPMIGKLSAAGASIEELHSNVVERLKSLKVATNPLPGIQIIERRPIYVIGDVKTPGSYPFSAKLTPEQAVALAGGFRTEDLSKLELRLRRTDVAASVNTLSTEVFSLNVRKTRLSIEIDINAEAREKGARNTDIVRRYVGTSSGIPAVISSRLGEDVMSLDIETKDSIISNEASILKVRAEILDSSVENLKRQKNLFEEEVETLEARINLDSRQESLIQEELINTRNFADRGLTPLPRLRETERELLKVKSARLEVASFLARARQRISEIDEKIADLYNERQFEIHKAMQEVALEIATQGTKLDAQEKTMVALSDGKLLAQSKADNLLEVYTVSRATGSGNISLSVDAETHLRPGDLLRVRQVVQLEMGASVRNGLDAGRTNR